MKRVAILGSTGSIGQSTLEVLALHPDEFEVYALSAQRRDDLLLAQCLRFAPRLAVLSDAAAAQRLRAALRSHGSKTEVLQGDAAQVQVAQALEMDIVMAAIVGAAGLASSIAAARAGKRVLLANKESLVMAGELFMQAMQQGGGLLIPIDSEHSAILQSLPDERGHWRSSVREITLTASGGPFRQSDPSTLRDISPDQACAHPNWRMGRKISVDSATMMNKALEVIEAHHLFDMSPGQIQVLIHPQSIVHSMVGYHDGSVVAQLGMPDMRTPIAYGLSYPQRMASGACWLDLARVGRLDFELPNPQRFPGLQLAYAALAMPMGACAVLNAANETAVDAFLQGRMRFTDIYRVNAETLNDVPLNAACNLDDLLELDQLARQQAQVRINTLVP